MPSETVADGSHRVPRQHGILASRVEGKLVPCGTRQADRGGEFQTVKRVSTNFLRYPVPASSAPNRKPKNNLTGRGRYPRLREVVLWLKANLRRAHISCRISCPENAQAKRERVLRVHRDRWAYNHLLNFRQMCRSLNSAKPPHLRLSVRSLSGVYRSEERDNGLLRPCCPRCPS